jgi:iron complex outermembrane receptor protein
MVGLMYFKEKGHEQSVSNSPTAPSGFQNDIGFYKADSKSLFAQENYHFTDNWRGTVGYRYTWDDRKVTRAGRTDFGNPTACAPPIPLTPSGCALPLDANFDFPAWLVGSDYKLTDSAFLYVKASQASLTGGINLREVPPGLESFKPERRREVEIGAKVDAFERRLRANLAIFDGDTKDAQRQVSALRANGTVTQATQNTGTVEAGGAELEVTMIPWEGAEVTANTAYLRTRYKAGTFLERRAGGVMVDRSGELVPNAPEWSLSLGATQKFNLPIGVLSGHLDYTYISEKAIVQTTATPGSSAAQIAIANTANQAGILPSFYLLTGRLALQLHGGVELSVWGKNLTNKQYYTWAFTSLYAPLGVSTQNQGDPRTYGVAVSYDF